MSAPQLVDSHGNPPVWTTCDDCGRWSLCLRDGYTVDPWLRSLGHGEGCALDWDEFGYGCSNCVPELAFCADREACKRQPPEYEPPEYDIMAIARAVLKVGGEFAEDFTSGRRKLTEENAGFVAWEIRSYWSEP